MMTRPDDTTDHDVERFFDAMSGASVPDAPAGKLSGAVALREALLAETRILREAESAMATDLTDDERRRMDNVRRSLLNLGALPEASNGAFTVPQSAALQQAEPSWIERIRAALADPGRRGPLSVAAMLALCAVVVIQVLPERQPHHEALRGEDAMVLIVEAPQSAAAQLVEQLRAAGAEAMAAPLNDSEWVVEITVPSPTFPAVEALMKARGLQLTGEGPFVLRLRRGP